MKKLKDFENFKLLNSKVIFGGDDDSGTIEKKKLKVPSKENSGEDN